MRITFKVIFLFWLVVYLFGLFGPRARQAKRRAIVDNRLDVPETVFSFLAFIGMQVVPVVYSVTGWLGFADYTLPVWAGWLGAATFAFALWIVWRSHRDLGRNWSPTLQVREGHRLVTEGIYRTIRHPIYASQWLWAAAQALLLWNWVAGLAGLVTFLPVYLYRVPTEERMMLDHFGPEYRAYMQRTGRVLPRVWR
jgi:protein-S-isoprenylcysteine O-methyltransferase Ste14